MHPRHARGITTIRAKGAAAPRLSVAHTARHQHKLIYLPTPPPTHTHTHTNTHTHTHTRTHIHICSGVQLGTWTDISTAHFVVTSLLAHVQFVEHHTHVSNLWGTTHTRLQLVGHHIYKHERAYTHRKIQIHTCRPGSRMLPAATCRWCCFSSRCVIYCSSGLTQSEGDLLGLWACSSLACGRKGTYTHNAACVFLYVPACTRASLPGG